MKRWLAVLLAPALALIAFAAEEDLPAPESQASLEIEPPILIQQRTPEGAPDVPAPPEAVDIAKVETDLARARRNAASGDRLFRAGIISKVAAEERVLRVVRLEAKLAQARLEAARKKLEEQKDAARQVEIEAQLRSGEDQVAQATQAADQATAEKHRAEVESASRNLQRQQKLLALGSARRSDVQRAQKRLADLQGVNH
ncbi:MAG: hypothetical protein ACR2NX_02050 [Chthoniobacterales bacterium]